MPQEFAVCRLAADAAVPQWAPRSALFCVMRTSDELSVMCESKHVPSSVKCERGWSCLKLKGPFSFATTGVLASVVAPLAKADVSIFAVSTYETDYVLVKEKQMAQAVLVLRAAGHTVFRG